MSTSLNASTMLLLWAHVAAHGQHLSFLQHAHVAPINPNVKHPADKINFVTKDNNASAVEASDVSDAMNGDSSCTGVETLSGAGGKEYRGCQARTRFGKVCQKWTEHEPHSHDNTPTKKPNFGLGEHNFCRNPDGGETIWCYTTDSGTRWQYCDPRGIYNNLPSCGGSSLFLRKNPSMVQKGRLDVNQKVYFGGMAQMGKVDVFQKVYIGSSQVFGHDISAFGCHPLPDSQRLDARSLKVCGTSIKVTLFLLDQCRPVPNGGCSIELGTCDSSLMSTTCETISLTNLEWLKKTQSYLIEECR